MLTADTLFSREFKAMMDARRAESRGFNLAQLPTPTITTMTQGVPKLKFAKVQGVKEPFFERLNGQEVELVGRASLKRRQYLSDGSFRVDSNGNYVVEDVDVPQTSVAILSPVSIHLKNIVNGKPHKPSQGFTYVDYVEKGGRRKYIYIIPREYVFRLNPCALVLTTNKRRVYFKGSKIALQNGVYVYLYLTPYKYRDEADARILGVKTTLNFDQEVNAILSYWVVKGVMFHPHLTQLEDQVNGQTNLGLVDLEGTIVSEDYKVLGSSMSLDEDLDLMEDNEPQFSK